MSISASNICHLSCTCCSELGLAHAGEDARGGYQEAVTPPAHLLYAHFADSRSQGS